MPTVINGYSGLAVVGTPVASKTNTSSISYGSVTLDVGETLFVFVSAATTNALPTVNISWGATNFTYKAYSYMLSTSTVQMIGVLPPAQYTAGTQTLTVSVTSGQFDVYAVTAAKGRGFNPNPGSNWFGYSNAGSTAAFSLTQTLDATNYVIVSLDSVNGPTSDGTITWTSPSVKVTGGDIGTTGQSASSNFKHSIAVSTSNDDPDGSNVAARDWGLYSIRFPTGGFTANAWLSRAGYGTVYVEDDGEQGTDSGYWKNTLVAGGPWGNFGPDNVNDAYYSLYQISAGPTNPGQSPNTVMGGNTTNALNPNWAGVLRGFVTAQTAQDYYVNVDFFPSLTNTSRQDGSDVDPTALGVAVRCYDVANTGNQSGTYYTVWFHPRTPTSTYPNWFLQVQSGHKGTVFASVTNGPKTVFDRWYHCRVWVSGVNPTVIKAKIWGAGDAEPDWQITASDSTLTNAQQSTGVVGILLKPTTGANTSSGYFYSWWSGSQWDNLIVSSQSPDNPRTGRITMDAFLDRTKGPFPLTANAWKRVPPTYWKTFTADAIIKKTIGGDPVIVVQDSLTGDTSDLDTHVSETGHAWQQVDYNTGITMQGQHKISGGHAVAAVQTNGDTSWNRPGTGFAGFVHNRLMGPPVHDGEIEYTFNFGTQANTTWPVLLGGNYGRQVPRMTFRWNRSADILRDIQADIYPSNKQYASIYPWLFEDVDGPWGMFRSTVLKPTDPYEQTDRPWYSDTSWASGDANRWFYWTDEVGQTSTLATYKVRVVFIGEHLEVYVYNRYTDQGNWALVHTADFDDTTNDYNCSSYGWSIEETNVVDSWYDDIKVTLYPCVFVANAVIKARRVNADAIIKRTYSKTFTANATKKATITSSFSANAYILAPGGGTFSANAFVRGYLRLDAFFVGAQEKTGSFTANAIVKKTISGSATANAVIKAAVSGSATANAIVRTTQTGSFSIDAILEGASEFYFDAVIAAPDTRDNFLADAYIMVPTVASFTVDASFLPAFRANAVIRAARLATLTAAATLHKAPTWEASATADAILRAPGYGTLAAKAWLDLRQTTPVAGITADAWVFATIAGTFTAEAELISQERLGTFAAQADIRGLNEARGTFSADARVLTPLTDTFLADAFLDQGHFYADAYVAPWFTADAVITKPASGSFTAAAYKLRANPITANAVKRKVWTTAFTADATLATGAGLFPGRTVTLTANAVAKRTQSNIIEALAYLRGTFKSFTADAHFARNFKANAFVQPYFRADAYIRGNNYVVYEDGVAQNPDGGAPDRNRLWEVKITIDGDDRTGDIMFAETSFTQQAKTGPGTFQITMRGSFDYEGGEEVVLTIEDFRQFAGYVLQVERRHAWEDKVVPITVLYGTDYNILFDKLVVYNRAWTDQWQDTADRDYGEYRNWKPFKQGTMDKTIITKVCRSYLDLPADLNYTDFVDEVDTPAPVTNWTMEPGMSWRQVMQEISRITSAVWWIDPYKNLHYHDRTIVSAPYPITDGDGGISSRNLGITTDTSKMVNDVLVWGTLARTVEGQVVLERRESDFSQDTYGLRQYAEFRSDLHVPGHIRKRASSILKRYRDPIYRGSATIFEPGFQAGQVADIRSTKHGVSANIVIQQQTITFPVLQFVDEGVKSGYFSSNAIFRTTFGGSFAADAFTSIGVLVTGSFTANATKRATIVRTLTANAIAKRTLAGSFTADALWSRTTVGSVTANAIAKATLTGALTANSIVRATVSGSLTADAVITTPPAQTGSFTANAVVKTTQTGAFTANAVITTGITAFTANAVIDPRWGAWSPTWSNRVTFTFTANAVIFKTTSGTFTANSIRKATFSFSLAENAVIKKTVTGTFTANAVIGELSTYFDGNYFDLTYFG